MRVRTVSAVVLFIIGLAVAALLPGVAGGQTLAATSTSCASPLCHTGQLVEQTDGLAVPLPVSTCLRAVTCGGTGLPGGGSPGLVLILAMLTAAAGAIVAAPRLVRRVRGRAPSLSPGVGMTLLRPPQPA